jgi:alkanesulfonate monooxygenase SsuD/methylene tetrahydromethanopterin reductase-like flavin-dependent oxidoreductase (luciferase family)
VDISIMIEGQMGVSWPRWKAIVAAVEQLGFAGLFRSDHFVDPGGPAGDSLEMVTSLTYVADHTQRIHFGPLVAPVSVRDPVMLARQAAALHDLSGGRMTLGLGGGWMQREHTMYGYELGDVDLRMSKLTEALEVCTLLLRSTDPVTFTGTHWRLEEAEPVRPNLRPGPPILVGGNGPKRTLPLAARYADIWNGVFLTPAALRERCLLLDALLEKEGRKPGEVRRSVMTGLIFGNDDPQIRAAGAIVGSAPDVREQLAALEGAGASEVMLQWFALDDLDGLAAFARAVL